MTNARGTAVDPVLLDLPTAIETERLTLRPPRAGDGAVLHAAIVESLVALRRYLASLPWVAGEQTVASAELFCRNAAANFLARRDLPFLVFEKATGQLVGAAGLHRTVWTTPKTEVGYWGRVTRAGNGFISEAVGALTTCAFERLHAVRVELVTDEENVASRKVAERCGFVLEGIHRHERRAPDGSLRNTCVYARLAAPARMGRMPIAPDTLATLAADYAHGMTSIRGRRVQRLIRREFAGAEVVSIVPVGAAGRAVLGLSASGGAFCATDGRGPALTVTRWRHGSAEAFDTRHDLLKDSLPVLGTTQVPLDGRVTDALRHAPPASAAPEARALVGSAIAASSAGRR